MKSQLILWSRLGLPCVKALLIYLVAISSFSQAGAAEYKVYVGDVLELSAASIPEFRHRATVDGNGELSFPVVGRIPARGKSLAEILEIVQRLAPQKVLRRRALDGSEHEIVIDGNELSLSMAEYNPVYLNGDVSNPGSFPYRPGMTVRQAIALAGGFDVLRTRMEDPHLLAADMRGQREMLLNDYAREQARIARIQTELGRTLNSAGRPELSPTASDVKALETEKLTARQSDFEKEKQYLVKSIESFSKNLSLLEKQMETETQRAKIDQEDLQRVEALVAKGMAPITRLSDTKRLVLLSESRASEIAARLELTRHGRAQEERKIQKLVDERRIELLNELQDAKIQLAAAEAKLSSVSEKMFYIATLRSQIGRNEARAVTLTIFRQTDAGAERIAASEESELLPRDVLEVAIRTNDSAAPTAQTSRPAMVQDTSKQTGLSH